MSQAMERLRNQFALQFQSAAEWRRRTFQELPDDPRNAEAALLLDRLAETVAEVPDRTLEALAVAYANGTPDLIQAERELVRDVGFGRAPRSATEFLNDVIGEIVEARG